MSALTVDAASMVTSWHGLSQGERNIRIMVCAMGDLGDNVNLECKEWVRDVVRRASGGKVIIPSTKPNQYQWYSHPHVQSYSRGCPPPGVAPGRVIQMVWHNQSNSNVSPHTAIVTNVTNTGMTWVESNWSGDRTVRIRNVSYLEFQRCVGNEYTLYRIK